MSRVRHIFLPFLVRNFILWGFGPSPFPLLPSNPAFQDLKASSRFINYLLSAVCSSFFPVSVGNGSENFPSSLLEVLVSHPYSRFPFSFRLSIGASLPQS